MSRYISTRGPGAPQSFTDILLAGMAPDGGLYIPEKWPILDRALLGHLSGLPYAEVAMQVMKPFIGDDIPATALASIISDSYDSSVFDHSTIAPLIEVGPNAWLLELFHGPTLSFKDYALQCLGRLFDYVLEQKNQRVTIVGATSGDTGSAAIEACRNCKNIDIFILHPQGRVSDVQRKQMTTVDASNVHNIALEGSFDDCQALVKALFADENLRKDLNLSAVNSINWARIMAQIVYYIFAALALGAPQRAVSFTVPTGNFGNVFAAHTARRMGLPIEKIVIGTNRNDILARFFETGEMKCEETVPSLSPSMDIQVSSNFERYLCDLMNRDHDSLRTLMTSFTKQGTFTINNDLMVKARQDFRAFRCDDNQTLQTMKDCYDETGLLIDPHTAAGLHAARQVVAQDPSVPMVVVSTAHPAKFPDAVQKATGVIPPVPDRLAAVLDKPEQATNISQDIDKIKDFVRQRIQKP